jgi:hypothetical protein
VRVLEQEAQQLSGGVTGAAYDRHFHCDWTVANRESPVEPAEPGLVTRDS